MIGIEVISEVSAEGLTTAIKEWKEDFIKKQGGINIVSASHSSCCNSETSEVLLSVAIFYTT